VQLCLGFLRACASIVRCRGGRSHRCISLKDRSQRCGRLSIASRRRTVAECAPPIRPLDESHVDLMHSASSQISLATRQGTLQNYREDRCESSRFSPWLRLFL
jgi:hypothetical protein